MNNITSRERELLLKVAEYLPLIGEAIKDLVSYTDLLEEAYEEEHTANIILYEEMNRMQEDYETKSIVH